METAISSTAAEVSRICCAWSSLPWARCSAVVWISLAAELTWSVVSRASLITRLSSWIMKLKESAMAPVMSAVTSASPVRSPSATPATSCSSF